MSEDAVLVLSILNKYEKDKKLLDTVNQLLENEYRTAYDLLGKSGESVAEDGFAPKLNSRKYSCCSQLLSKIAAYLQQPRRVRNHYLTDDGPTDGSSQRRRGKRKPVPRRYRSTEPSWRRTFWCRQSSER